MENALKGKVAVITGSGQGVGRGIALFMASVGAKIVTNNRKPLDKKALEEYNKSAETASARRGDAESVAEEIRESGGEAVAFYGDISDYDTAGLLIQKAIDTYGRIDILINNAAGLGHGTITDTTPDDWEYQTAVKLCGAYKKNN